MSPTPGTPAAAAHFEAFLCAGIADLCRSTGASSREARNSPKPRVAKTLTPGPVADVADLAMYLLLLTRGLQPVHKGVYPHRERLVKYLGRIYRLAADAWDLARESDAKSQARILHDTSVVRPAIETLTGFIEKHSGGLSEHGLFAFGVNDIHGALVRLSERIAVTITQKAAKGSRQADGVLGGATLVAATAGLPEGAGGHARGTLVRAGVRTALAKPAGTASAGHQNLRRCMKRLGKLTGVSGRQS
jgi:hypothetical protein